MTQKIVIKVQMTCDKCRSKAMELVAATGGVDSVALAGEGKDQVVVVGDGMESVKLTSMLHKKVGPAQLVQAGNAKEKKPEPAAAVVHYPYPWHYYQYMLQPAPVVYEHHAGVYAYPYHSRPDTCTIM